MGATMMRIDSIFRTEECFDTKFLFMILSLTFLVCELSYELWLVCLVRAAEEDREKAEGHWARLGATFVVKKFGPIEGAMIWELTPLFYSQFTFKILCNLTIWDPCVFFAFLLVIAGKMMQKSLVETSKFVIIQGQKRPNVTLFYSDSSSFVENSWEHIFDP